MSLPLARRIAKAALLVAAGAAPVMGAAGTANALDLPQDKNLSGLTEMDGANLGESVDSVARKAGSALGETGGEAVRKAVPAAGKVVGAVAKTALQSEGSAEDDRNGGNVGNLVGDVTGALSEAEPPAGKLPTEKLPTPNVQLPLDKLPTHLLPGAGV